MKLKLLIEDDGRKDKGAGEGKTKLEKEEDNKCVIVLLYKIFQCHML